jgi:hypothetical protein
LDRLKTKPSETGLSELDKIIQKYIKEDEPEIEIIHRPDRVSPSNGPTTPAPRAKHPVKK